MVRIAPPRKKTYAPRLPTTDTTPTGAEVNKEKRIARDAETTEVGIDPEVEKRAEIMTQIDFDIYDRKNPNALLNRLDVRSSQMVAKLPRKWTYATESKVTALANPDDTLLRLRIAFWEEFNRACRANKKMDRSRICYGICAMEFWSKEILNDWRALVFIIRPPRHEMFVHKALMLHGYDRIHEILQMPLTTKVGKTIKEELPNGKIKATNTRYQKVDMAAIRAIRDTMRMLISAQQFYTVAEKFGNPEPKKGVRVAKKPTFPSQGFPHPDPDPEDPSILEDEIAELEQDLAVRPDPDAVDVDLEEIPEDADTLEEEF